MFNTEKAMNHHMNRLLFAFLLLAVSHAWGATKTSTMTFTSDNYTGNPVTADDGAAWSIDKNCNGPYFDNERGIYFDSSISNTYVDFVTTSFAGKKIKKITLQAAGYPLNNSYPTSFFIQLDENVDGQYVRQLTTNLEKYEYTVDNVIESKITIELYCFRRTSGLFMKSITVEYEGDEEETIDVNFKEAFGGWSSLYYKEKSLKVPDDVTAYTYTVTGDVGQTSFTYGPGDIIPMNTAVVLKLNDGYDTFDNGIHTSIFTVSDQSGERDPDNQLLGFDEASTTIGPNGETEGYEFFRLTLNARSEAGTTGFYWGASQGAPFSVGAHKAYLALPITANTPPPSSLSLKIAPFIVGDANIDGQVNVTDVMLVVNHLLGTAPSALKIKRSDFNQDGSINVSDVMGIVAHILGNTTN